MSLPSLRLNVSEEEARCASTRNSTNTTRGIDLHARSMYLCIIDQMGTVLVHRNLPAERGALVRAIDPYREDLV